MSEEDLLGTIKATYVQDGSPTVGVAIKINESLRAELRDQEVTISDLRSQLAAKDKLIEELETLHRELVEEINAQDGVFITNAEIGAAWEKRASLVPYGDNWAMGYEAALEDLGIVACPECGGFGEVGVPHVPHHRECPLCAKYTGHGWVEKEHGDE